MYKRKIDSEMLFDRRASIGSTTCSDVSASDLNGYRSTSSDHYNPTLRLLHVPKSSCGSLGFHLTRSKWDPYPWVSAVDPNTPAKCSGLKAGDCVLEVNEKDVLGMRIFDISELIREDPERKTVSLLLWSTGCVTNCNPESLCCGPMPLNLERLSACMQTILTIIECPICLDTIAPPTMQCQNGHILCVKCRILSESCPVCRQRFYPGRSLIAEQIYNSITDTFNLRNQDKLREKLFGAKYKRPTKDEQRREKQQLYGRSRHEVNKLHPPSLSTHKFLAKLLGKAYSMDNLSTSSYRVPLLSMKSVTNHMGETLREGEIDNDDENAEGNSVVDAFDEQSKLGNPLTSSYSPRPVTISKQFSLSAQDLSKKENDGLIAIQSNPSMTRIQHLRSKSNLLHSQADMILPMPAIPIDLNQRRLCASLGTSIECVPTATHREDTLQITPGQNVHVPERIPGSYCFGEPDDKLFYNCPLNCGSQLNGSTLQHHVKVDHCIPILCYGSSSAELSLPLRVPLDESTVLLMCEGKDFWIKLRAHGEGSITASALLQGSEDESADFMMEIRLGNRIGVYHDDNDAAFVNKHSDDATILERQLVMRSIVRSMMVTTWAEPIISPKDGGDKSNDVLYNRENIRLTFAEAIDYQNLLIKIIVKSR